MEKPTRYEVEAANEFLKARVVAQAVEDGIHLSDAEIATLTYSELCASQSERELANEIDITIGAEAYEQKIAGLLHRAYSHDDKKGLRSNWDSGLRALRYEDLYVLVMIQSAGIPAARTGLTEVAEWYKVLLRRDSICLEVVGLAGVVIVLSPLADFFKNDLTRGIAFVLWLALLSAMFARVKRRRSTMLRK